jgi:hypothetical protein
MTAAMLAFTLGFIILKLLDHVIDPAKHSSPAEELENGLPC